MQPVRRVRKAMLEVQPAGRAARPAGRQSLLLAPVDGAGASRSRSAELVSLVSRHVGPGDDDADTAEFGREISVAVPEAGWAVAGPCG